VKNELVLVIYLLDYLLRLSMLLGSLHFFTVMPEKTSRMVSADYFLGDPDEINQKMQAVADQGKA